MRLRYLTIFALTIFMTNFVNAAEIYNKEGKKINFFGKINSVHYLSKDENKNGAQSFAQLGLNGETKIYGNLIGFGMLEHEVFIHSNKKINYWNSPTKLGYVGLKLSGIGSIDYGKNYSVLHNINSWTRITPIYGFSNSLENLISGPIHGVITYRNENFLGIADGMKLSLQYQGKNENSNKSLYNKEENLKESDINRYGMSISYDFGNHISVGAAYMKGKRAVEQKSLGTSTSNEIVSQNKDIEACSLGVKYDTEHLYLSALYEKNHNLTPIRMFSSEIEKSKEETQRSIKFVEKSKGIELIAQYQFDFGLRPSVGYFQSKIHDNSSLLVDKKQENIKKFINIGASYNLNKNMLAFLDYKINLLSKKNEFIKTSKVPTENVVSLGITYKF